jgi:putative ABC transport system permease protein
MSRLFYKTLLRNFWKNKSYSLLNMFGLSIGITCAALIFLWVENEYSYDRENSKRNYLYSILENQAFNGKIYTFSSTPGLMAPAMKMEIPGLLNTGRTTWDQNLLFSEADKSIFQKGYYADSSMISMINLPFVQGEPAKAFSLLYSIVVSEKMARKFFGDNKNVLGRTLKADNKHDFTITGVFKDFPTNSSFQFEWLSPFEVYLNDNQWLKNWGSNSIKTYVELLPATSVESVNKKLDGFIQKRATQAAARPFLFSMADWHLRSEFIDGKQSGGRIVFVSLFSIIAWIILIIACINFMNLATARSEKRAKEVGVRKVLGAEKRMLIAQFIGEALFLSLLSVVLSLLFIWLCLPSFNYLVESHLGMRLNSPVHLLGLLLIMLVCGLIAGIYPALYLSSFNPVAVFKGLKMKSGTAAWIRKALVVFQFTVSIALIICTIIVSQQLDHIKSRDLGYNRDNLLVIDAKEKLISHFSSIRQDLMGTGKVKNVSLASLNLLFMGSNSDDFTWDGKDPGKKILITGDMVSPEYLSTSGNQLIAGKDFQSDKDSMKIIINESLAKLMGKGDPIGKLIRQDTSKLEVIGVVRNFVYGDMYGASDPLIFFCYPKYANYMYIRLKQQEDPEKALAVIEAVLKVDNPGYPFDYQFVDNQFAQIFKTEMMIGKLSRLFASLAILISCLGLLGLTAYTAERRTKEIGIRKVLGASVGTITALLSKDFLKLVLISGIIAFPISWWAMNSWLSNYAYRIQIQWWVFLLAAIIALLIALFTISFQSIKTALANPIRSLRTE